jgi:hypothetical protein
MAGKRRTKSQIRKIGKALTDTKFELYRAREISRKKNIPLEEALEKLRAELRRPSKQKPKKIHLRYRRRRSRKYEIVKSVVSGGGGQALAKKGNALPVVVQT